LILIGVDASEEKRFELMRIRARQGDPTTWNEFIELSRRDRGVGQSIIGQQVDACLGLAGTIIDNNGSLAEFHMRIQDVFATLGIEGTQKHIEKQ
jgi:dephospho-CoA kinase